MFGDQLVSRGIRDARVLAAFAAVPRELFVSDEQRDLAYADSPLPIGHGQTISQPYVVALTAQALQLRGDERVLEIGSGSGYAAAILGALAREVITIERIAELAAAAAANLRRAKITNVTVHVGDGTLGWAQGAPYDAIAVAASAPMPPPALLEQLAIGGRLVLPYGRYDDQRLAKITREAERFVETDLGAVRFVPLVGAQGW
jgi:protein-L-isoaspartate(D-aspartate) O-methyltransferase